MKFGRHYKLLIENKKIINEAFIGPTSPNLNPETALEITDPLTCEFQIERNANSSLNNATFKLYNLSKTNRDNLVQNRYSAANSQGKRKKISFQVGYENLSLAFTGSVLEAYPYRQGVDIITFINAQDGGFESYTTFSNTTLAAGTTILDGFKTLASAMGLQIGAVGKIEGTYKRGRALIGNNFSLLSKDFKDEFFIDLNTVNMLHVNEYIKTKGGAVQISSESGLLGTPILQGTKLVVNMLLEPRINVGNLVDIKSSINPKFDGQYKVIGISHKGIISEATSGDASTTLQLDTGSKLAGQLIGVE